MRNPFSALPLPLRSGLVLFAWAAVSAFASPSSSPSAFVLVDALGQEVRFDAPPRRIAVAGRGVGLLADLVYLFPAARERVVAVPESSQPRAGWLLEQLDAQLATKRIPGGGATAGPEQIAPFRPDVVVMKAAAQRSGEAIAKLGVPVVYLEGESPEHFLADVARLGMLFGDARRAEEIAAWYRERLERVRSRVGALATTERPRVLLLTESSRRGAGTFGSPPEGRMQARMIEEAGGIAVTTELPQGGTLTAEQVAAMTPDRLIVASYRGDPAAAVAGLRADPIWSAMPAVAAGRVLAFPIDFVSWDQPGPRWILGQLWLARALHPERFTDLSIRAEVVAFYSTLYGLAEAKVRGEALPELRGDLLH